MPDSIDQATVEQVAKLARIHLSEQQLADSSKQLADVLNYISQLEQVELPPDVEPFFGATESVNAVRTDEVTPSVQRETILHNAPETDGEFYTVPPVFK